jgi:hypothetical protein
MDPSDSDIRAVFRVLVIDVLDLDDDGALRATAMAHLRSALLDPAQDVRAWTELTHLGQSVSEQRAWRRRSDIAAELDAVGAAVEPGRRHLGGVRILRRFSDANLAALAAHSCLSIAGSLVRCDRPAIHDLLNVDGSFVIVGDPGCGKSGVTYELASRLATSEDVLVLSVDNLPDGCLPGWVDFGVAGNLVEVLREWSGAGRATLILDGLDAVRGEGTTWLERLCESLIGTRWRVIATIRRFDLGHNVNWQKVFRGEALRPGTDAQAPDISGVRHYLLGDLSDDDLAQLTASSPTIAGLLEGASTQLIGLVKNPFNLRLAVELLEAGASVASFADTCDQLRLLHRCWKLRVIDAPDRLRRIRALRAITTDMLASRRLRADASVGPDPVLPAMHHLLGDGVLQEPATRLLAYGAGVVVFSHHILFDFAVAALIFTAGDESTLADCLGEDANLTVIARPSVDLHLADVWRADPEHTAFAAIVAALVHDGHAVAGVAAARIAAENIRDHADLRWLTKEFRANQAVAATFTGWLCGAMDAADAHLVDRLRRMLDVWTDVIEAAMDAIEDEFIPAIGQVVFRMLLQLNKIDPLTPTSGGAVVRACSAGRLMEVCLAARTDRAWLAVAAAQLLPRAVTVDAGHARTLLQTIDGASFAAFGSETMRQFVEGIDFIAEGDPDAATEALTTLWTWEEERDEATHITQGVLSLTSTRKQDLDNVKWLSGEKFRGFVAKVGLLRAVKVVATVLRADSQRYQGTRLEKISAFGAEGQLLPFAHDLRYGPGHGAASAIVDAFLGALAAEPARGADVVAVVKEMVACIDHPEFWRRLLVAVSELPAWQLPVARVLASGALLKSSETGAAAGKFLSVLSRILDGSDHARLLEEPIRSAADLFPPDADERRQYAVDQLLSCLEPTRIQDPELRSRLARLVKSGDLPPIPELRSMEATWEPLDLRDIVGAETHDALSDSAKNALDELQRALDASQDGGKETTIADLVPAFERAAAQPDGRDTEPVQELITRAGERLASAASVEPGTDIGELVAQILLDAATGDRAVS